MAKAVLDLLTFAGVPNTPIDFSALLAKDSLNSQPPALVQDVFEPTYTLIDRLKL
jgi:hypothetical protein